MLKKIILVSMFFAMFFMISCSEDSNPTSSDPITAYRIVKRISYDYDQQSDVWIPDRTWNLDYDTYGRVVKTYYDGSISKDSLTYDNTSTVLPKQLIDYDQVKGWVVDDISVFTYENGKTKERLWSNYNEGNITNNSKTVYTYDNNLLTSEINYTDYTGEWEIIREETWTYASGKLIEHTYESSEGTSRYTYYYENEQLIESIRDSWYNDSWNTSEKYIYTYEDGKLTQVVESYYYNSEWVYERKTVYSYTNGMLSTIIDYDWNNDTLVWEDDSKSEYKYDENGNYNGYIYHRWDEVYGEFIPRYKSETIYEKAHGNYMDMLKAFYPDYFYTGSTISQYFPQPTKEGEKDIMFIKFSEE